MKIGIVSQSYYPRYGGVTEHVHALAHELRRREHEVTIITSFFRRGEKGFTDGVLRIGWNILVPFNRAFVDFAIGLSLKRRLRRAFRDLDLDVVHVHARQPHADVDADSDAELAGEGPVVPRHLEVRVARRTRREGECDEPVV